MPAVSALSREIVESSEKELLEGLSTSYDGLSETKVRENQEKYGFNIIHSRGINIFSLLIRQFTGNPLIIILAVATFVSLSLGETISSYYIFGLIIVSVLLGFFNEYSAEKTVESLLKKITPLALVIRAGQKMDIPVSHLTVGDVVFLSPGSIIPADLRLIKTGQLEVNESVLTGESAAIYKSSGPNLKPSSALSDLNNICFMGTSVESGSGRGVVVRIGKDTEFGQIAKSTTFIKPVTRFQMDLAGFGRLIIKVILVLTVLIFAINAFLGHDILKSLLFTLAIAVGLTPELLPVIVTVSLSHGAGKLARKGVVVKQLISLENLGNMDILCTDKTGTLTEGQIEVVDYLNAGNTKDLSVLMKSLICNSAVIHHKIIGDSIDKALWQYALKNQITPNPATEKLYEEPFDFNRRLMFTVVRQNGKLTLITRGSPDTVLSLCQIKDKSRITEKFNSLAKEGIRVIAVASKSISSAKTYTWADVNNLIFDGYITFLDTPKVSAKDALLRLKNLNVQVKVITGDNELITGKICSEVGLNSTKILVGTEIDKLKDDQLKRYVNDNVIFARVTPEQKLRIINALRGNGHAVGFLGDGINDIPALRSADTGISVNSAVDVAKEAAGVVLLRKSLNVIADGIIEGRKTFNNTIKYIIMSTGSNFGEMLAAAGASFVLPFLPMAPLQILLENGLYDMSQMTITSDNTDHEFLVKPKSLDIVFIRNYMLIFGTISALFSGITFVFLLSVFRAGVTLFQTGWFIESLVTEMMVVFSIRTGRVPFFKSRPGFWLTVVSLLVMLITLILPFSPLSGHLGFTAPPLSYFALLLGLSAIYLTSLEVIKYFFLKKYQL